MQATVALVDVERGILVPVLSPTHNCRSKPVPPGLCNLPSLSPDRPGRAAKRQGDRGCVPNGNTPRPAGGWRAAATSELARRVASPHFFAIRVADGQRLI